VEDCADYSPLYRIVLKPDAESAAAPACEQASCSYHIYVVFIVINCTNFASFTVTAETQLESSRRVQISTNAVRCLKAYPPKMS